MGRWEPDAQGRLLTAAMELFGEHGYEATTTAQIAERAGLTKTTLFRLFADKREIVFQGQGRLITAAETGIRDAPPQASPIEVLEAGITALADEHHQDRRQVGRTLDPILAASPELQERAVYKRWSITRAVEDALAARLADRRAAGLLADLGVRAYYTGYEGWVAADDDRTLSDWARAELAAASATLQHVLTGTGQKR
ncbi:TetR/AcrR family transcriptional regulator [Actinoplanes sp. N902-109]|uniref:TetR/AcrR family transcriptional regulator n=1 Tax=Actinoplanes sp. (strain N902-109) TaxID=649831 RepID=UPI0003295902|nr:TetR/AcrR family transcriptional regulator [Actinoplanes sp. N902-109]AGL16868.1 TetR family transcriptional regulator [Actinoplanes sp. N902-109]